MTYQASGPRHKRLWIGRGLALGLGMTLTGCACLSPPPSLVDDLQEGRVDAHHVVFLCEGMLKDLGSTWDRKLQAELLADGAVAVTVNYFTGPLGVWFNYGSLDPGDLLARTADELTRRHEASGSKRELIIDAVGFSIGCEVILRAASCAKRARFRRVVFLGSSSFCLSPQPMRLMREGKIGELRNYWSPLDVATILAPLGAGEFGLRLGNVENKITAMPHIAFLIGSGVREELRSYLLEDSKPHTGVSPFDQELADVLQQQ